MHEPPISRRSLSLGLPNYHANRFCHLDGQRFLLKKSFYYFGGIHFEAEGLGFHAAVRQIRLPFLNYLPNDSAVTQEIFLHSKDFAPQVFLYGCDHWAHRSFWRKAPRRSARAIARRVGLACPLVGKIEDPAKKRLVTP